MHLDSTPFAQGICCVRLHGSLKRTCGSKCPLRPPAECQVQLPVPWQQPPAIDPSGNIGVEVKHPHAHTSKTLVGMHTCRMQRELAMHTTKEYACTALLLWSQAIAAQLRGEQGSRSAAQEKTEVHDGESLGGQKPTGSRSRHLGMSSASGRSQSPVGRREKGTARAMREIRTAERAALAARDLRLLHTSSSARASESRTRVRLGCVLSVATLLA